MLVQHNNFADYREFCALQQQGPRGLDGPCPFKVQGSIGGGIRGGGRGGEESAGASCHPEALAVPSNAHPFVVMKGEEWSEEYAYGVWDCNEPREAASGAGSTGT